MQVNNQSNKFSNIAKKRIKKTSRNSKLKGKYYINEKTHLDTEKNFVLYYSLKINKRGGGLNKLRGSRGSEKNRKINKRLPRLLGT